MPRLTDIWRVGVVAAPFAEIAINGLAGHAIGWVPAREDFTFLADPFGLWRDEGLYLFAEAFDYRDRRGHIEVLHLNRQFELLDRRTCLSEPWHLSYPFVFEAEGDTWMLPEAHRSGGLHLYRATQFPARWERTTTIALDGIPVDASPVFHDGLWWLFYAVAGSKRSKLGTLHLAYAEKLRGPWRCHAGNPVRVDPSSARPGGTPFALNNVLIAPMQDCSRTYGGNIQMLWIDQISPTNFKARPWTIIGPRRDFAPFDEGLHTLSACGDVTLIVAKRVDRSWNGLAIDMKRYATQFFTRS